MSRIGKLPVHLPQGVTATVGADNVVLVKGPLKLILTSKYPLKGIFLRSAVPRTSPVTVPCTDSTAHSFTTW